jgi:hypothetical protein
MNDAPCDVLLDSQSSWACSDTNLPRLPSPLRYHLSQFIMILRCRALVISHTSFRARFINVNELTPSLVSSFPIALSPAKTATSQSTPRHRSAGANGSPVSAVRPERRSSRSTRHTSSPIHAIGSKPSASSTPTGRCRRSAGRAPRTGSSGSSCVPVGRRSASTHA